MRAMLRLGLRMQLALVLRALTKKIRQATHPSSERSETLWRKLYWPDKEFKVPHFRAPVALFKRPRQPFFYVKDETMGWGSRSAGGVKIHEIDFPHRMLRQPYVQDLASRLRHCLARAAAVEDLLNEQSCESTAPESKPVGS